jgi:hypothetical protein
MGASRHRSRGPKPIVKQLEIELVLVPSRAGYFTVGRG